jgi:chromosome partitioning protein
MDCELPLFAGSIRRLAAFQKAALAGVLINSVDDPRAPLGWADYQGVGEEATR